ncbi:hypothetical protein SAG0136_07980 [Streptococcus agalactiae LMG 14747]|uniref:Uncharacterized protein n=1 Tax=Streptococcus agalactiae LMG 14747 TaxID=1154860 RepID=V6Z698_STRAG|nr:hypothetical protein SAG0136_07980 [Streptococcus agalactiae LMG 14747]
MNNEDKPLADMLGVGTDTINNLTKLMGGSDTEVYNTLVKEYTLYTIMENIMVFSIVMLFLTLVPTLVTLFSYNDYPGDINYKHVLKLCFTVMVVLIFAILVANILSPMLAPNINIIKEIGR